MKEQEKPTSNKSVMTFGRMNPVTVGHAKLVNRVIDHANKIGADHHIFLSHTHDAKKNPLTHSQKVGFARKFFPHANIHSEAHIKTAIDAVKHLSKQGYKHVTMMVGSDRVQEFHNLLHKYNGKEYNIPHLEVKSAGERDPDAEGVEGMSASKMRDHAAKKNFSEFKKGVPNPAHARELYKAVRKGMKLEAFSPHFKALFIVGGPGSGKDFIINSLIEDTNLLEMQIDKFYSAVMNSDEVHLDELIEYPSLILNGNADNFDKIIVSKRILETMGYDTAIVYVYTSDEESKARNDERIARGVKTFTEEVRYERYTSSVENLVHYVRMFEQSNIFDNSSNFSSVGAIKKQEILGWLHELGVAIGSFFESKIKNESAQLWLMENTKKPNMGMNLPKVPKPTGNGVSHTSNMKGYKRVKVGSFWKLVPESAPGGIGGNDGGDTDKYEPMAKDAGAKKKKYTNIKMKSDPKNKGTKASLSPPSFFDARMGVVPSGGVGLTVSHYEHGTDKPVIIEKSLERLRKNMAALINNIEADKE